MNTLMSFFLLVTGLGAGSAPVLTPAPVDSGPQADSMWVSDVQVEPAEVQAGMFFHGAAVSVSAILPEGLAIAVACVGPDERLVMNRKGKVFGLIWMNVEEVEFNDTPTLYQLETSAELGQLASPDGLQALGVGYGALEARAGTEGDGASRAELFDELVRLKESEGLYSVSEGTIRTSPAGPGTTRMTADFRLPAKTAPGVYGILFFGFSEGRGTLLARGEVLVTQVGAAAFISTLATDHGLLYGALAVAVAVSVGLLTGMVFGLGSKKAH